jgi:osmoprotectant transport system permease protein
MTWIRDNVDVILDRTLQHAAIAVPAIVLCFVLSLPLGALARRLRRTRPIVLSGLGLMYAIPSLPLFIVLPALLGTGLRDSKNVVIALTLYGIALMVRVTVDALDGVDHDVVLAATAMGYSSTARFWKVQLPLAGPVLVAGMRVVAVSTVSLTTVGAVLGVESLGLLFTDGIQRDIPEEIFAGIAMTLALAVALDACIVGIGRLLLPWAGARGTDNQATPTVALA